MRQSSQNLNLTASKIQGAHNRCPDAVVWTCIKIVLVIVAWVVSFFTNGIDKPVRKKNKVIRPSRSAMPSKKPME